MKDVERDRLRAEYQMKLQRLARRKEELRAELAEVHKGFELYQSLLQALGPDAPRVVGPVPRVLRKVGGTGEV